MMATVQLNDTQRQSVKGVLLKREQETLMANRTRKNKSLDWVEEFRALFENKTTAYRSGTRSADGMFSKAEEEFLRSIGATPQEIFDFVEDWCDDGEPDPEAVLAITKARRDYFFQEQQGRFSEHSIMTSELPSRHESLAGLEWFPRIIEKARAKLRGELPPDLMYGCGGDRRFLKMVNVDPAEFLQVVREAEDNVDHIVKFVMDRLST
ncbi:MAG: DUF5069 domain-containing protein [Nitrospirota bacterium]|nr:DUF5069 domain-containing protein [Nitrospirota bacterium]MDH5297021.1 DUF5069 domain-containing protein [Nitrospirota bacterium]MDH5574078.1 DUF5069 domain-containing protein [Nitrospirota bacterium]